MSAMDRGRRLVVLAALLSTLVLPSAARAHDRLQAGPYVFTLGWENEPALAGHENGVEVDVAGNAGRPVSQAAGKLGLEVSFGDAHMVLPLEPGARAGLFRADLVPTRAGVSASKWPSTKEMRAPRVSKPRTLTSSGRSPSLQPPGAGDNVVRVLPPLNIEERHITEFVEGLSAAAAEYEVPVAA